MSLVRWFMGIYQYLFHPGVVLAAALVVLVYRDWAADRASADQPSAEHSSGHHASGHRASVRQLGVRLGALLAIEVASVVPVGLYLVARRPPVTRLTAGTDWRINLATVASLLVGGALLWGVWSAKSWGTTVSDAGVAIVAAAIPYGLVAPVWNVSGHVTFTLVPTLLLALADDRFWPALAIPAVMVVNRPVLGAHTWLQSLGGLVVGAVGVGVTIQSRSTRGEQGR